jgi:cytosine/adenosine deaminase-related metal-dependent hydrolase
MTDFLITGIKNGLTGKPGQDARFQGSLRVKNGIIAEVGDLLPERGEKIIDAENCVVCPGFVNTHHHLFQCIMKAVPSAINKGLDSWLMEVPYKFWPKIDAKALKVSTSIGLAELALSGTTTVADHHYMFSESYDYDPAEVLFETAARFGMRFVLGRGGLTTGRPWHRKDIPKAPTETLPQLLGGIESAAKRWHDPSPTSMRRVAAAPVTTVFNLHEGEVREIARAARALGLRLHTHLSENDTYVNSTMERFGKRPVHWMADQEWIGPDVWFAHLVKCEPDELAALAQAGTAMAHCPQANARLGSGIAPAPAMHRLGGIISLAVDGTGANEAGDMAQALYAAFTLHRAVGGSAATTAEMVLQWATSGGARALGFEGIGTLEPGKAADLLLIELNHPRYFGQHDPVIGPIVSGGEIRVRHSFVGGRELVVNGKIPWLDIDKLGADAVRVVKQLQSSD